jgi:hypothetical protein
MRCLPGLPWATRSNLPAQIASTAHSIDDAIRRDPLSTVHEQLSKMNQFRGRLIPAAKDVGVYLNR